PDAVGWDVYDAASAAVGMPTATARWFREVFQEAGVHPGPAMALASAWMIPAEAEPVDFKARWGAAFKEKDGVFAAALTSKLPESVNRQLMRDGLLKRPAFVEEVIRLAGGA